MKNNVGSIDRGVRIVVGLLLVGAGVLLSGILQILAVIVGVVLILTSFVGYCPIYGVLGMSTAKASEKK